MAFVSKPSDAKAIIPTTSGGVCDKFLRAITGFPQLFYNLVSDMVTEQGELTTNFRTMICALGCTPGTGGGGGTPNPNMPAPSGVNATDGAYSDKVRVSWNAVTTPSGIAAVTFYKVYRSLSTNTDPNNATLLVSVAAPTVIYDDNTAVEGTTYNYWVRATNGTDESAFSGYDIGSASAPTSDIDAVADLQASYGLGFTVIALVWTPPTGATKYDVYRGTTNVFADATKIYSDISPASTTLLSHPTNNPTFWDNEPKLLLTETPPSAAQDYYYWVVAKKDSPPAVSDESNDALGRVNAPAIYNQSDMVLDYTNDTYTVPAGITKMWVALRPSGGGGAGGGSDYGGGGGGGGQMIREAFTVAENDVIDFVITAGITPNTGNAPRETDGDEGATLELQINAVAVLTADPGQGGVYNPAGGGTGGAAGASTGDTAPVIYDGGAGGAASGSSGGKSGYMFGSRRTPQGDPLGVWDGNASTGGAPGSGTKAVPINPDLAEGGYGTPGRAFIVFGT